MRIFFLLFLVGLFGFMIVAVRIEINRSGRTIGQLQNDVEVKEARNQYLKLEISRLSSPANISQTASEELGLVMPKPHQVVVLEDK